MKRFLILAVLIGFSPIFVTADQAASPAQTTFSSPPEGLTAVIQACKADDTNALIQIFGADGKDIILSGDPSDDKDGRAKFVKAAEKKSKVIPDPKNADRVILSIGEQDWPFPIPMVRQ